jgi:hypothetical protein
MHGPGNVERLGEVDARPREISFPIPSVRPVTSADLSTNDRTTLRKPDWVVAFTKYGEEGKTGE